MVDSCGAGRSTPLLAICKASKRLASNGVEVEVVLEGLGGGVDRSSGHSESEEGNGKSKSKRQNGTSKSKRQNGTSHVNKRRPETRSSHRSQTRLNPVQQRRLWEASSGGRAGKR